MRVSNKMMSDNIKANLFKQAEQLLQTQEKITTGKRINRASDDPVGMAEVLNYRKTIAGVEQYNKNITNAKTHVDTVDSILETVTDLLNDAKRIASDPSPELRDTFALEVETIREQVLQLANSQINGNYIFAGDLTDAPPFDSSGTYSGDSGTKDYVVGENIQVGFTADGSQIFQSAADVFAVLDTLRTELQSATPDPAVINAQIVPLSDAIEQITHVRAENAGRYKRLEATENHYAHFKVNIEEMLSRTEDADMAEAIIDLQVQKTAYESTLATSAKIITPSLIDFLS